MIYGEINLFKYVVIAVIQGYDDLIVFKSTVEFRKLIIYGLGLEALRYTADNLQEIKIFNTVCII